VVVGLVVVVAAISGWLCWWLYRGTDPRWNIVLITLDTTRADRLSCYGYEHIKTPAIDELARRGVRYARCYSPVPLTLPGHTSILTGLYPFDHGLRVNGAGTLDDRAATLAEVLGARGYQTGAVIGAYVLHSKFGLRQGFDFYDEDFSAGSARSIFFYVERNAKTVTDTALAWLDTVSRSPFFLWVHYFDPHAPYEAPGFNPATATTSAYDAEIVYTDTQLRRLIERLRQIERHSGRQTLIVLTADHGEALWDHGEPTHGLFVYNDTLHVPLIVDLPSAPKAGVVVDTPVSLADIYPSVLHWLGIPPPYETRGRVLPTAAETGAAAAGTARVLYFETRMPYETYGWSPLEGVLTGSEKYIAAPIPELYDLFDDPLESHNLYTENDARAVRLRRALAEVKGARLDAPPLAVGPLELDEESVRKLEALGYVSRASDDEPAGPLADPKNMTDLHRQIDRARVAIETERYEDALSLLQDVAAADPSNTRVFQLYLHLLTRPEIRDEVVGVLRQRLDTTLPPPFDVDVPLRLAVVALQERQFAEAEDLLKRALRANPGNAQSNYLLAQALAAQQRPPDVVLPPLQRAHELDPEDRDCALALGRCLERLKDYSHAAKVYDDLLQRDPDDAVALNNSAWVCYQMQRERETALERAQRAVALQPDAPGFRDTLGCILLWSQRAAEAAEQLRRAIEAAPSYAIAHYHLGLATEALGHRDGAVAALRKAVELAGDPPPDWLADARDRLARLSSP
jgi:arylsulfatase A-like enzyme